MLPAIEPCPRDWQGWVRPVGRPGPVCVGEPGLIVTSAHVLGGSGPLRVYPFALRDGQAERLGAMAAEVVYESARSDIAILRLRKAAAAGMKPPAVALPDSIRPGAKVYAGGNPGLGRQVLDQSITEGIVSSTSRRSDAVYIRHTAAVNPGHSDGPLLDERGVVVGLITLKADLEGVSFAIPTGAVPEAFGPRR